MVKSSNSRECFLSHVATNHISVQAREGSVMKCLDQSCVWFNFRVICQLPSFLTFKSYCLLYRIVTATRLQWPFPLSNIERQRPNHNILRKYTVIRGRDTSSPSNEDCAIICLYLCHSLGYSVSQSKNLYHNCRLLT